MRRARRFRTYKDNNISDDCAIWEAARASTAAPTFFKAAEISVQPNITETFIDGGMGCNNPTLELCAEAQEVYKNRKIDCIVSLGTGTLSSSELSRPSWWQAKIPIHVVPTLVNIVNDCEKTHDIMFRDFKNNPDTYFRFSVPGMGDVGLEEWKLLGKIRGKTVAYLNSPEVDPKVNAAVKALRLSLSRRNLCM